MMGKIFYGEIGSQKTKKASSLLTRSTCILFETQLSSISLSLSHYSTGTKLTMLSSICLSEWNEGGFWNIIVKTYFANWWR